jgi:threonine dehydrogenase-like Zn-dependent dehydrogenase
MKALLLQKPGQASIATIPEPVIGPGELLLKVRMVGFCGSDLNSFRGLNPLVSFPRIPGHEVSATVMEGDSDLPAGTDVALSPYTNCGKCASCRRGRPNACQFNQTLGVQRDGALTEFIAMPREKLFRARLSRKELCLVEPLTVGFHAVARTGRRVRYGGNFWLRRSRARSRGRFKRQRRPHHLRRCGG